MGSDVAKEEVLWVFNKFQVAKFLGKRQLHWGFWLACSAFFVITTVLFVLWRVVDYMVPKESNRLIRQKRRHDLQKHKLFYRADIMQDVPLKPEFYELRHDDLEY